MGSGEDSLRLERFAPKAVERTVPDTAFEVDPTGVVSAQEWFAFSGNARLNGLTGLNASIDESDLGAVEQGQEVTFQVDAYPTDTFTGVVKQIRLSPVVASNVVTYAAIISAPNTRYVMRKNTSR